VHLGQKSINLPLELLALYVTVSANQIVINVADGRRGIAAPFYQNLGAVREEDSHILLDDGNECLVTPRGERQKLENAKQFQGS
jgi:hypothetical protein